MSGSAFTPTTRTPTGGYMETYWLEKSFTTH